jgi:hypothetical protein
MWCDLWASGASGGDPVQGTFTGSAFTARQLNENSVGAMPHGGSVSPLQKHLAYTSFNTQTAGSTTVALLYDRVLTYEACTFTAASVQSMTNTLSALRYIAAGQPGLQVAVTADTSNGATASNLTALVYTDQTGATGISAAGTSPAMAFGTSASVGLISWPTPGGVGQLYLTLNAGNTGVRKIESYTTSAVNTGTICFVLNRPLAYMPAPVSATLFETDQIYQMLNPARIYDGACLNFFCYGGPNSNGNIVQGRVDTVWG